MSEMLLSALLDGECDAGEAQRVLDAARASAPLRRHWSRLCLVHEALRGVRVRSFDEDFCAAVMAALERGAAESLDADAGKIVPPTRTRRRRSWWRPLAGLAVAASLAAVAGVGLRAWLQPAPQLPATAKAGVQPAQVAQSAALPVVAADPTAEAVETRWSQLDADTARQLNEFLLEHSTLRAAQGMGGALSYARMTARPADYRQDPSH